MTNKYAVLISIFYVVGLGLNYLPFKESSFPLLNTLIILYHFISNLVIAAIVADDMKKQNIKKSLIIWATIFFDILGVGLLLMTVIHKEKTANA
ncbi:MAG: hypothetical protein KAT68_02630 [Bacteroidales bacterium]|nr:hypothetical protein [Bacteroidales bacterium]